MQNTKKKDKKRGKQQGQYTRTTRGNNYLCVPCIGGVAPTGRAGNFILEVLPTAAATADCDCVAGVGDGVSRSIRTPDIPGYLWYGIPGTPALNSDVANGFLLLPPQDHIIMAWVMCCCCCCCRCSSCRCWCSCLSKDSFCKHTKKKRKKKHKEKTRIQETKNDDKHKRLAWGTHTEKAHNTPKNERSSKNDAPRWTS